VRSLALRLSLAVSALIVGVLAFVTLSAGDPSSVDAHPLGNFTVNRYARLELYSDAVRVRYVLDMAEIPAFQEIEKIDADGNGEPSALESETYLADTLPRILDNLSLSVGGEEQELSVLTQEIAFPEGQAGLDTLRISLLLSTMGGFAVETLSFADDNYSDRVGWKEIIVQPATGVTLAESSVSTEDVSQELTTYPGDLLSSPLDVRVTTASFDATRGAAAPTVTAPSLTSPDAAVQRSGGRFASLIDANNLSLTVILLSLLAAFGFGAVHALEPGHGKTFVAAYFVGVKGTAREAMLLGLIVAVTHTIGVFAIGLLTLFGSQFILPETLYPWLSLASGVMILLLGVRLLAMRSRGVRFLSRFRAPGHDHEHQDDHDHHHHSHERQAGGSPWKGLIALGLADGLTPSPTALIVLLAAVSLDRLGLGVLLIVAFSVGLATVLTLVSLALVYLRRIADWFASRGSGVAAHPLVAWATGRGAGDGVLMTVVPVGGAIALTVVGVLLTARALSGPGLPLF
jgi:ABC-type nickel/cobalt efflux system permease component RcnA